MAQHSSNVTTDHGVIRRWTEERGGKPATVRDTHDPSEPAGILRIDFPGYGEDQKMEHVDWDDFFDKFEESNLAFVYQDKTSDGQTSRFCKFVDRESATKGD